MFKINASKHKCFIFEELCTKALGTSNAGSEFINVYDKYSDKDRQTIDELTDYKILSYDEIIEKIEKKITKVLKR